MKRFITALLIACLALTGCSGGIAVNSNVISPHSYDYPEEYASLSDPELVDSLEEGVYSSLISELDSSDYLVEEVQVAYVSQEYLDELSFNSTENIFFGYTLDDVISHFGDTPYVFTVENEKTVVKEFESYDDTWDQIASNVATGTGVILILATISFAAPVVGAPQAITAIFTFATKGAVIGAAIEAPVSGAISGIMTGLETGNPDEGIESAALSASEGYKMGAIVGGATGALSEFTWLKSASANGLTLSQAAAIQKESKYPLEVIQGMRNMDEYLVYKKAGLKPCTVATPYGKRTVLARDLDLARKDAEGNTNLYRMEHGKPPLDTNGHPYELHHVGQKSDGTLAILTREEHDSEGLHIIQESEIDRPTFNSERRQLYRNIAPLYSEAA